MALSYQIIHQEDFILNVYRMINTWKQGGMDLTADAAPIPAVNIIYDVMHAAGIPDGGIAMALGEDIETVTGDDVLEPVTCCVCGAPAMQLVAGRNGHSLACPLHAKEALDAGLIVITPTPITVQ